MESLESKVGVLSGRSSSFSAAVVDAINCRQEGIVAEDIRLGPVSIDGVPQYAVILDRFSHELPSLRAVLKAAALAGVIVVNDPFMATADDKFFEASLAAHLGIATPRTVIVPNQATLKGAVQGQGLACLLPALDWDAITAHVGMPCIIKDAHGSAWTDVFFCRTPDALRRYYDLSGRRTMIVQEQIVWDEYLRCICVGREHILPVRYVPHESDPQQRFYQEVEGQLSADLAARVVHDSRLLVGALGYDLDTVEWAVHDGVPYVIDSMNPMPDLEASSLPSACFEWAVTRVADMVIAQAQRQGQPAHPARAPNQHQSHDGECVGTPAQSWHAFTTFGRQATVGA